MSDLKGLERRIQERIGARDQRRHLEQDHLLQRMMEFEERHGRFVAIADRLVAKVVRPRMQKLREHFDNTEMPDCESNGRHHCTCRFHHTERFPAEAKLELAISRDGECRTLLVLYSLDILPVFFQFEGHDQLPLPLDSVDEEKVAAWIDDKLVGFVETYLRLETVEQYQTENLVTDPVCGMQINKAFAAAQMKYQGKMYYFCLEDCLRKFDADPGMYLAGPQPVREEKERSVRLGGKR
jgi:YHS domain-containing protein